MPESPAGPVRIAVLVSGRGRNLDAILQACADGRIAGEVVTVISNRGDAPALARAQARGIAGIVLSHRAYPTREAFDDALAAVLEQHAVDIVALAGFMRILGVGFVERFLGRLVNIHPSLLPKFPGLDTHRRAIEAGEREHGATVHFVTPELDGGPGIIQGRVSIKAHDSADTLAERVMNEVEVKIYPQALSWLADRSVELRDGRIFLKGQALDRPATMPTSPNERS